MARKVSGQLVKSSSGNDLLRAPFPGCVPFGHGSCSPSIASPRKSQQQTVLREWWINLERTGRFIKNQIWVVRRISLVQQTRLLFERQHRRVKMRVFIRPVEVGCRAARATPEVRSTCYVSTHGRFWAGSSSALDSSKLHHLNGLFATQNWPTECTLLSGSGLTSRERPVLSP